MIGKNEKLQQPPGREASEHERLVMRLRRYNEWRRGADFEQPEPADIGRDIDDAIEYIESRQAGCSMMCESNAYRTEIRRLKSEMIIIAAALMRELHSDDVPDRVFATLREDIVLKLRSIGLDGA